MSEVHLACGLPFIQDPEAKQTNPSIGLRVTAVVLGTLAVIVGALILFKVNGFSQFGPINGWTTASIGAFVVMLGASIRCVEEVKHKTLTIKGTVTIPLPPRRQGPEGSQLVLTTSVVPVLAEVTNENKTVITQPQELHDPEQSQSGTDPVVLEVTKEDEKAKRTILSQEGTNILSKDRREKVLLKMPQWLSSEVDNISYKEFPDANLTFKDVKEITDPIFMYSAGETVGIHMRLRVEHVCLDDSYDRTGAEKVEGELEISSKKSFVLQACAFTYRRDGLWILESDRLRIEHRNGAFQIEGILGSNRYNCYANSKLEQEVIEEFINTEKDDQLQPMSKGHLGWVLLRVLKEGSLEVRERRTDHYNHPTDKPVGYWKISLDA